jgi:hypothetical protein
MALVYPPFDQINQTRLAQLLELLTAVIQSYNPAIELRQGTVNGLVLQPRGLLTADMEQAVLNALQSGSISYLVANPTLADPDAVNRILGNYRLSRLPGTVASGQVTIILGALTPVIIQAGTVVTISGQSFTVDATYAARTSPANVIGPTDRLLNPLSDGTYAFNVGVVAALANAAGNVRSGTAAAFATVPLAFIKAFAAADFTGGRDAQSNASLLAEWQSGLSARTWSNRMTIEATIRNIDANGDGVPDYANLVALSIIGFGDPEMLRDQHSIWPVSAGGRSDLYAQTQPSYTLLMIAKTASLLSKVGATGTWQFGIGKNDAPGYYEVAKVCLPDTDQSAIGFSLASDVRSFDLTGVTWAPDITTAFEGTYTRYQASICTFVDTVTDVTFSPIGAAKAYNVYIRIMPQLNTLQDYWNNRANRPLMGDILVKAPVPCFVSVSFTLTVPTNTIVDVEGVAVAVAAAINQVGFTGILPGSLVDQVLHNLYPNLLSVTAMGLSGRIRRPDGNMIFLSSTSFLSVPTDYANGVSPHTVLFLTEAPAIGVTVVNS